MDNWTPIRSLSTCTPIDHPEYIMPYGQTINSVFINDTSHFYCLNRGDKNPFLIPNSESNGTNADSNTWTAWINEPCPDDEDHWKRRCLGSRPDICVDAACKYILLRII